MRVRVGFQMRQSWKIVLIVFALVFQTNQGAWAQTAESLKADLDKMAKVQGYASDITYLNTANALGFILAESSPDSAIIFLDQQLLWCREAKFKKGEAVALKIYGNALQNKGDFNGSIEYYSLSLKIAESLSDEKLVPGILNNIGLVYYNLGNYTEALHNFYEAIRGADMTGDGNVKAASINNVAMIYFEQGKLEEAKEKYQEMLAIYESLGNQGRVILAYNNIGDVELKLQNLTEALENLKIGHQSALSLNSPEFIEMTSRTLADIYSAMDSLDKAEELYRQSIVLASDNSYGVPYAHSMIGLANLFYKKGEMDEALNFAEVGRTAAESMRQSMLIRDANELLAKIYEERGDTAEALKSFKLFKSYNDSIHTSQAQRLTATLEAEYEFSKKTLEYEKVSQRQQWIIFSTIAGLIIFLVILFMVYRNRNQLNKTYHSLQEKTHEIEIKNEKLESTLNQLRATQTQLVQAEKMASLGELTAGIAHEIQNPLNFVTNFSEISTEMIQEILEERDKTLDQQDQTLLDELLADIKLNLNKINQHGRRADAIVKGMLQHSRNSPGEKVLTDLNTLINEYLRLSFHGLRAKDKAFAVEFATDLDPQLPKTLVIPQDISRVLLNLFNNAFYACGNTEYRKLHPELKPLVKVTSEIVGNNASNKRVKITVSDNGAGIPDTIIDKIFQPFFTTKPSGQGTGLGLSLSYDVVIAHGGELKVKSKPGEFTTFSIFLPV